MPDQQALDDLTSLAAIVCAAPVADGPCPDADGRSEAAEDLEAVSGDLAAMLAHSVLNAPVGIAMVDMEGRFLMVNGAFGRLAGRSPRDLTGTHVSAVIDPADLPETIDLASRLVNDTITLAMHSHRCRHPDGRSVPVLGRIVLVRSPGGAPMCFMAYVHSIEERRSSSDVVPERHAPSDAVVTTDRAGRITGWNTGAEVMFGWARERILGRRLTTLLPERGRPVYEEGLARICSTGDSTGDSTVLGRRSARLLRADGTEFDAELVASSWRRGDETLFTAAIRDITERLRMEHKLLAQATTDPVTGHGNRSWFTARLGQALRRSAADGTPLSVITIDIARFNILNTSLGATAGDRLLHQTAAAIAATLRLTDTLARIGGDEFGVLLEGADQDDAVSAAERIRHALLTCERCGPVNVPIYSYLGTATYGPRRAGTRRPPSANDLLRNAGLALAASKRAGIGQITTYNSSMRARARRHLALLEELSYAIERGELSVHYQPLVTLGSGRLRGAEALLRWNSARFGPVPPAEFIPLAEDTGLIVPIGRWVLEQACQDAARWGAGGRRPIGVSVNVSGRQLDDDTILTHVADALGDSGLTADLLTVEVTESVLAADSGAADRVLRSLHDRGVRLAVDDFGTGYSNLAALHHLPIDVLKIDKSFVDGVENDERSRRLLATVIAMGRVLGCTTLAEGIETVEQHEHLIDLGCEHGQGFLFGHAAPGPPRRRKSRKPDLLPETGPLRRATW